MEPATAACRTRPSASRLACALILGASLLALQARAADRQSILDFATPGTTVDRTGHEDASDALARAVAAANVFTAKGEPACVYIPPGRYRIVTPPPMFARAGCVRGDGASQSFLMIDKEFSGDLFSWSEAWIVTTPGPRAVGLTVQGDKTATAAQNAFVFYDRNDQVFMDDIDVWDLHGRALYSGVMKDVPQAYMRESHMRSLRFFNDGAVGVPVVEFGSEGKGNTDATNEIRMSQVDIYGQRGAGFVIRNNGSGGIRAITIDALRIEGKEDGSSAGDLLTIGDPTMLGNVSAVTLTALELIDPLKGYAALRLTAAPGSASPYNVVVEGWIGGGTPTGQGLRIDAGRTSTFHFSHIHTSDTNVVIGRGVSEISLDGGSQRKNWTFKIDPASTLALTVGNAAVGAQ